MSLPTRLLCDSTMLVAELTAIGWRKQGQHRQMNRISWSFGFHLETPAEDAAGTPLGSFALQLSLF